ncbi:DUF3310 domain-containing protein, partial [Corallococcus carmarthensis]|uniref:DUF3310 domain-containing protein n=1 Tax=Corallococcus carmarthensis TaxID=2316728 RepID=UPI001C12989B
EAEPVLREKDLTVRAPADAEIIAHKDAEIKRLSEDLAKAQKENDNLKGQNAYAAALAIETSEKHEDEIKRLRNLLEESDHIRRNVSETHAKVQSRLQERIEQLEFENSELTRALEATKQQLAERDQAIAELTADRSVLLDTIDKATQEESIDDPVNHPAHYTAGGIETIDFIRAKLTPEEFRGYCKGNVLKYVACEGHKGGDQDLRKAAVYLGWAVGGERG